MVAFVVGPCSGKDATAFVLRRLAELTAGKTCEGWWSQTGSNRRPHACKARALPAELWPRDHSKNTLGSRQHVDPKFTPSDPPSLALKAREPSFFVRLAEPKQAKPAKAGGPGKT